MTERERHRQYRRRMRELNSQIYEKLAAFLVGPKFTGRYRMEDNSNTGEKKIEIVNDFTTPNLYLSFDFKIYLCLRCYSDITPIFQGWAFVAEDPYFSLAFDQEEYVRRSVEFLRYYIFHASRARAYWGEHGRALTSVNHNVKDSCPASLSAAMISHEDILKHEFVFGWEGELDYMCKVFADKKFKRSRNDYRKN